MGRLMTNPQVRSAWLANPVRRSRPGGVVRALRPVSDRVRGWALRFARAGWPLDEVAGLFDVDPAELWGAA